MSHADYFTLGVTKRNGNVKTLEKEGEVALDQRDGGDQFLQRPRGACRKPLCLTPAWLARLCSVLPSPVSCPGSRARH